MIDYVKLFNDYKIPTDIQSKGWVQVNCPFCDDSGFNGGFNIDNEFYNCWRCGSKPNNLALGKLVGVNPYVIGNEILPRYRHRITTVEKQHIHAKSLTLPTDTFTDAERNYLYERHFNPDKLHKKFGIVGGGLVGKFAYRIILPLFYEGKLVSWTGRSILSKKRCDELDIPRYKNLSIEGSVMNPKDLFFNMDNSNHSSVILVEGPMDCVRMGDDCICSFGTGVKQSQQEMLAERYKTIFIAFDDEPEAQAKARHLGNNLTSLGVDVEIVNFCKDYGVNDPGDMRESMVREVKKELGFIHRE